MVILLFFFILLLVLFAWSKYKKKNIHKSDWYIITCFAFSLTLLLFFLYRMKYVGYEEPKTFPYSKIDGIIALGIILGFIGAFWAVWARRDADKALKGTEKILDALGNSFDFPDILNNDKFFYLLDRIPSNNTTISLYLGFPCIGLLYRDAKYDFKNLTPKRSLQLLTAEIKALQSNIQNVKKNIFIHDFKLNICVLDKEEAIKIMNDKVPGERRCEKEIHEFYTAAKEAEGLSNEENKIQINFLTNFQSGEKLRFITVNTEEGKQSENKAFVWIANIFDSGEKNKAVSNYKTFDSKGFQTNDSKFIKVLENVFV